MIGNSGRRGAGVLGSGIELTGIGCSTGSGGIGFPKKGVRLGVGIPGVDSAIEFLLSRRLGAGNGFAAGIGFDLVRLRLSGRGDGVDSAGIFQLRRMDRVGVFVISVMRFVPPPTIPFSGIPPPVAVSVEVGTRPPAIIPRPEVIGIAVPDGFDHQRQANSADFKLHDWSQSEDDNLLLFGCLGFFLLRCRCRGRFLGLGLFVGLTLFGPGQRERRLLRRDFV